MNGIFTIIGRVVMGLAKILATGAVAGFVAVVCTLSVLGDKRIIKVAEESEE